MNCLFVLLGISEIDLGLQKRRSEMEYDEYFVKIEKCERLCKSTNVTLQKYWLCQKSPLDPFLHAQIAQPNTLFAQFLLSCSVAKFVLLPVKLNKRNKRM